MYKVHLTKVLIGLLFMAISFTSLSQEIQKKETGKAMPTYIETSQVPSVIMEKYNKEYPLRTLEVWNGYPEFLDESDWYGCNPYLYNCINPKYYVVDFTKDEIHHKVIYTAAGKKVATHVSMNAKTIHAIAKAILHSKYKNWKINSAYEEIFKGDTTDRLVVYKIEVTKDTKVHYLFYKSDGTLIKDLKIKD